MSIGGSMMSVATEAVTPGFANVSGTSGNQSVPLKKSTKCNAIAMLEPVQAMTRGTRLNNTPSNSGGAAAVTSP